MKAIAAMSLNRVIGRDGKIPWHIPEDFKWFKQKTFGGFVIMGRKTFEDLDRPLPNRTNIVLTRAPRRLVKEDGNALFGGATVGGWVPRIGKEAYQLGFERLGTRDVWLVASLPRLLAALHRKQPKREVFVIGGAQIYEQLLPYCTDLYLTIVQREVEGTLFSRSSSRCLISARCYCDTRNLRSATIETGWPVPCNLNLNLNLNLTLTRNR
jgi:dihydrofolate reductase